MRKWVYKVVFLFAFVLFAGMLPKQQTQAMDTGEYKYYFTINYVNKYEISKEQYESIRNSWNSLTTEGRLEIAHQIVPESEFPSKVISVGLRMEEQSAEEDGVPSHSSNTENTQIDKKFVIAQGVLVQYRGTDEAVTIPENVTKISAGAFRQNTTLKKVIVPKSVKIVSDLAFYQCSNLQFIVFAGKADSIGSNMIYQCDAIINIVAPKGSKEYAYGKDNDIPVTVNENVALESKKLHVLIGDTPTIKLYNAQGAIRWKSSNTKVVSVNDKGKIKAKKAGKAQITAQFGGKKYTAIVQVRTKSEKKRVDQIIKSVIKKGMSTKEKVKAVHNWLIRNVKYDYYNYRRGTVPAVSHTAKGALLRGTAVCDGYSKAFMKIMKKLKIPCKMIAGVSEGGGHAWNLVKVDGKWLHVDVTFDDPIVNESNTNTRPRYTYFLKTSAEMRKDHAW